jgi:precorrin-8X/cobalt-precorrin-8 methylmutase
MIKYSQNPATITAGSFAIIRAELSAAGYQFEPAQAAIIERMIHATADFEFAAITCFSAGAIEAGVRALQAGCSVVTDVHMIQVGISTPRLLAFGGATYCFVADEITRQQAAVSNLTRSAVGITLAAEQGLLEGSIVAIGNAPTALYEVIRLIGEGVRPALVIGVPVGFVSTAESKTALTQVATVPWIVTSGRKGGSTVAVAIVNALLRLAAAAPATDTD